MKYSAALALALSPLVLAKSVQNMSPDIVERTEHLKGVAKQVQAGSATQVIIIWVNVGGGAATSTVNSAVTVTKTVTAGATAGAPPPAAMATHSVIVGGAAGLQYTPSEIKANLGDMVVFTFQNANHTVTQSTFDLPCDPMAGGMDSGFQPNPNNTISPPPQVAMQVMDTKPLWFYCKQSGHCGKGMVFSINPTADKTGALFQSMAIQQKGKGTGSAITGNATASAGAGSASASAVVGAPPPPASSVVAGGAPPAVATGVGSFDPSTGVCTCAVAVGAGAFPVAAQGVGAFGGYPGGLPMAMMERSP